MHHALRPYITAGIAIAGASLIAVPAIPPPALNVEMHAVRLTSGDLGDGTALVMGPSGFPIPPERYADAMNQLYLQPNGFTGSTQILPTPEGLYPVTGVKSLELDPSVAQGQQILDSAIQGQIAADPDHPVWVSGFSQSSTVSSLTMSQLAEQGVPSDDVHFVLVGDPNNPNGGLLERFDVPINGASPTIPSLGITFSGATPDDLYPTDIYTNEYDGFADFPRYPINLLADINALLGIIFEHAVYAVEPDANDLQDAILLPGSADLTGEGLTNYYMIPAETLPLLAPLQLLPVIGQPLYDLLEPDMRILVNLGYGSITDGWDPGPANVPTTFGVFPTDLNWGDVATAPGNGLQTGVTDAFQQLLNPDNYKPTPLLDNPVLAPLVQAAYTMGLTDSPDASLLDLGKGALSGFAHFPISDANLLSSPTDLINDFTGTLSADYATLLPVADTFNALLTTLPSVAVSFITEQLADGNLLNGIGEAVAA
ncbi:MAG: PE-PPE domain-containing protein, partial [Mycobacterium sp.]